MSVATNATATMKLAARVHVKLTGGAAALAAASGAAGFVVAVEYYPLSAAQAGHQQPLWSAPVALAANGSWAAEVPLYRLRAGQRYQARRGRVALSPSLSRSRG